MSDRYAVMDGEIISALLAGLTGQEIARRYGFEATGATVVNRCRRATGMTPNQLRLKNGWANQATPPTLVDKIVQEYVKEPISIRDLAKRLDTSTTNVSDSLNLRGIARYQAWQFTKPEQNGDEVVELYLGGMNTVELAEWFDSDDHTIRRVLERRGVKRRSIPDGIRLRRLRDECR